MSNQIKLTIDLSDELVDKVLTVIALSGSQNPMKAMMMGMGGVAPSPKEKLPDRPSMGFKMDSEKEDK
jgi:phage gpG-like protein